MADVMSLPQMPLPHFSDEQDVKQHMQQHNQHQQPPPPPPSSGASTPTSMSNAPRRPPRKSTLTQQQKNQKRQRATQDQLMTLEVEFNKNPTPTALVRERIAEDINMTERSVQIWFQNRRAKIKNIAKRSIENGEDCDNIPESMRQYLAMQQFGPNKGMPSTMLGRSAPGYGGYGGGGLLAMNGEPATGKVVIQHFACRSLSIGTWRRVGQSTMDLVIFYSPDKACITYYINNENAGYKIEYPFASIKNITLEQGDVLSAAEGASQRAGGLIIELTRPPRFYMDSSGSGGFYECSDFTEEQQASRIMVHHLGGPSKVLSGQLAKLVSLEAYQNRHAFFDPNGFAVSAPVSPVGLPRPASQPNQSMAPPNPTGLLPPEQTYGMMGPPGPRGHKRQRSRSVPATVDLSTMRHPMPSFLIQHDGQTQNQAVQQDQNIFAPVPQHQTQSGAFAPAASGPGLSIDTSATYSGFSFAAPMSATTANSPSDYGTPAYFTGAPQSEPPHTGHYGTPFHTGFLAVDPSSMIGTTSTPLPLSAGHADPVIADHSPPFNGVGRSQSADMFSTPGEHPHFQDDSLCLSESFNKQIALPFHSPYSEDSFHSPMPDGGFSYQSPMPHQRQDVPVQFQSPPRSHPVPHQIHQDSGIAFSSPHLPQDQQNGSGMVYHDSKVYHSPSQMHSASREQSAPYQQSPLVHATSSGDDLEMPGFSGMYGTIDPHNLGQNAPAGQVRQQ